MEEVLVGQRRELSQTRDRWDECPRAGSDDEAPRPDRASLDCDRGRVVEPCVAGDHLDALSSERLGVFRGGDGRDGCVDACYRFVERQTLGGAGQQGLRRDAAGEGAVATDGTILDDGNPGMTPLGLACGHKPSGTAADHHQVVVLHRSNPLRSR